MLDQADPKRNNFENTSIRSKESLSLPTGLVPTQPICSIVSPEVHTGKQPAKKKKQHSKKSQRPQESQHRLSSSSSSSDKLHVSKLQEKLTSELQQSELRKEKIVFDGWTGGQGSSHHNSKAQSKEQPCSLLDIMAEEEHQQSQRKHKNTNVAGNYKRPDHKRSVSLLKQDQQVSINNVCSSPTSSKKVTPENSNTKNQHTSKTKLLGWASVSTPKKLTTPFHNRFQDVEFEATLERRLQQSSSLFSHLKGKNSTSADRNLKPASKAGSSNLAISQSPWRQSKMVDLKQSMQTAIQAGQTPEDFLRNVEAEHEHQQRRQRKLLECIAIEEAAMKQLLQCYNRNNDWEETIVVVRAPKLV